MRDAYLSWEDLDEDAADTASPAPALALLPPEIQAMFAERDALEARLRATLAGDTTSAPIASREDPPVRERRARAPTERGPRNLHDKAPRNAPRERLDASLRSPRSTAERGQSDEARERGREARRERTEEPARRTKRIEPAPRKEPGIPAPNRKRADSPADPPVERVLGRPRSEPARPRPPRTPRQTPRPARHRLAEPRDRARDDEIRSGPQPVVVPLERVRQATETLHQLSDVKDRLTGKRPLLPDGALSSVAPDAPPLPSPPPLSDLLQSRRLRDILPGNRTPARDEGPPVRSAGSARRARTDDPPLISGPSHGGQRRSRLSVDEVD